LSLRRKKSGIFTFRVFPEVRRDIEEHCRELGIYLTDFLEEAVIEKLKHGGASNAIKANVANHQVNYAMSVALNLMDTILSTWGYKDQNVWQEKLNIDAMKGLTPEQKENLKQLKEALRDDMEKLGLSLMPWIIRLEPYCPKTAAIIKATMEGMEVQRAKAIRSKIKPLHISSEPSDFDREMEEVFFEDAWTDEPFAEEMIEQATKYQKSVVNLYNNPSYIVTRPSIPKEEFFKRDEMMEYRKKQWSQIDKRMQEWKREKKKTNNAVQGRASPRPSWAKTPSMLERRKSYTSDGRQKATKDDLPFIELLAKVRGLSM
jgi:hypothetical protein